MKRYRFEAAVQRSQGWGAFVLFPHDVKREFHRCGRVPVQVRFHGLPYTGSLIPHRDGHHRLSVPCTILAALAKTPGQLLQVELWEDISPRTIELPTDFDALLQQEALGPAFATLTISRHKEYRNWITSAKRVETRQRRMAKAIELLRAETDAPEVELSAKGSLKAHRLLLK